MLQYLPVNLKVYLEGFLYGITQVQDTTRIYLAQITTPFTLVDSTTVVPNPFGISSVVFSKAPNGNYYIIVKHRNHLETWSGLPLIFNTSIPVNYDFTTDSTKAYGFNMKKIGNAWVLIVGDENQDGSIDAVDVSDLIIQYGNIGYLSCDFNGDASVDAADVPYMIANYGLTLVKPGITLTPKNKKNDLNYFIKYIKDITKSKKQE